MMQKRYFILLIVLARVDNGITRRAHIGIMLLAVNVFAGLIQIRMELLPLLQRQFAIGLELPFLLPNTALLLPKAFGFGFGQFPRTNAFRDASLLIALARVHATVADTCDVGADTNSQQCGERQIN